MVSHARPLKGSADTILYYILCIIQLLYFSSIIFISMFDFHFLLFVFIIILY